MSIEYALDNLNIRKRSRDLEGLIVTKAINDDDLGHPNQRLQIAANVLLLVIGQYQRRKRNHRAIACLRGNDLLIKLNVILSKQFPLHSSPVVSLSRSPLVWRRSSLLS